MFTNIVRIVKWVNKIPKIYQTKIFKIGKSFIFVKIGKSFIFVKIGKSFIFVKNLVKKIISCQYLKGNRKLSKIANLIVVSIITMIRLETLYPKNAVIDRLRSKYAFEDKIFCGGGQGAQGGQEGQEHPEENRTERYLTPN